MRKLAVLLLAVFLLSGCASTKNDKLDKPDLSGTLAFCAGRSLTPEHAETQLPLLGWTPQEESNTALELLFWTSFGRDYVSDTPPVTDESFGELVEGAFFIAGSTLGNSNMSPDQPSYTNGPYKLTTLALDVGSGHCIVSAPHLFNDVFITASRKHELNLEFTKHAESRGVAINYFSMPQDGQVISMTFDAAELRGGWGNVCAAEVGPS